MSPVTFNRVDCSTRGIYSAKNHLLLHLTCFVQKIAKIWGKLLGGWDNLFWNIYTHPMNYIIISELSSFLERCLTAASQGQSFPDHWWRECCSCSKNNCRATSNCCLNSCSAIVLCPSTSPYMLPRCPTCPPPSSSSVFLLLAVHLQSIIFLQ